MRPPTPIPKSRVAELESFRKSKWPGHEYRRYLCVWLRVSQGLPTKEIAAIVGWHVNTVRHTQKDFIDRGAAALADAEKAPGRPRQCMAIEEEAEFLAGFEKKAGEGQVLVANEIKAALEKKLGRAVHKTTVYRMMKRHTWRKVAPRPKHPKQSKEAIEAFKKGASQRGRRRRKQ